ncbi:Lipopolysaccharide-induced tumor necrosis factor-alpha factor-like protein [Frankliniella fusca]|uniref:Lipopolysaccharide-induced tumor necrosis factor-alpha factor-like protein n=1 Tax=Frankliniella fusca TaxID=407009 RepID=A0AAE1HEV9_9NEOP|nr:Lipopolysaccharide-induced tumor necrosis factor-alpha factor-like protein [Frankliniella fusca]
MSKQGFVETAAPQSLVPSAPPSYDEAMQQASALAPMPSNSIQQQPLPMPMPMPQGMPMAPYPAQPMPQPAPYYPPGPAPSTEVTVHSIQAAPTIVYTTLGKDSTLTVCHKCNKQVMTSTNTSCKCLAHFCCCCLMISGVGLLCSCIPYCLDSCKIVKHSCPNCRATLGTYRP